ncbi:MAG: hypothetical protein CMA89_04050 [Euryarchaeota archaeon]|jgi:hypothetical protein|nr:hypothetical protein [Euryarchaeota archaeon]MED6346509.1 hypothetical protein [Candidatus Thermoplasmatota archaeon]|tara:strand:+ start:1113 stop:1316 length:204 start_codon:yes stop_codon:yes gene_type:complete
MSIEERRNLVVSFLRRCVRYANDSIDRKKERGEDEEEISKWSAYRDFTDHAIMEVSRGDLDSWLEEE